MPINPYHAYQPYVAPAVPYPYQQLYEMAQNQRKLGNEGELGLEAVQTRDRVLPGADTDAQAAFEQEYLGKAQQLAEAYGKGSMPADQFKFEVDKLTMQKKNDLDYRTRMASFAQALEADKSLQAITNQGKRPLGIADNYSYTNAEWDSKKDGIYAGSPVPFTGYNTDSFWQNLPKHPQGVYTNELGENYQVMGVTEEDVAATARTVSRQMSETYEGKQQAEALRRSLPQLYKGKTNQEVLYAFEYARGKAKMDEDIQHIPYTDADYNSTGPTNRTKPPAEEDYVPFTQGWTSQVDAVPAPYMSYIDKQGHDVTYGQEFPSISESIDSKDRTLQEYSHIKQRPDGTWWDSKQNRPADSQDVAIKTQAELDKRILVENRNDLFRSVANTYGDFVGIKKDSKGNIVGLTDKISEQNRQRELAIVRKNVNLFLDPWVKDWSQASIQSLGVSNPDEARKIAARAKEIADANKMDIGEAMTLLTRKDLYADSYYLRNPGVIPSGAKKGKLVIDVAKEAAVAKLQETYAVGDGKLEPSKDRQWTMEFIPLNTKNKMAEELIKFVENANINNGDWYDPKGHFGSDSGYSFPQLKVEGDQKRTFQGITVSPIDNKLMAVVKLTPVTKVGTKTIEDESKATNAFMDISSFGDRVLSQMDFGQDAPTVLDYARQVGQQQLYMIGDDGYIKDGDLQLPFRVGKNNVDMYVKELDPFTGIPTGEEVKVSGKFGAAKFYAKQKALHQATRSLHDSLDEALYTTENGGWNGGVANTKDPELATPYNFRKSYFEKDVKDKLGLSWSQFQSDPEAGNKYFQSYHLPDIIKYIDANKEEISMVAASWNRNFAYNEIPMDKVTIAYLAHRLGKDGMVSFLQKASRNSKIGKELKAPDGVNIYSDLIRFTQNRTQ